MQLRKLVTNLLQNHKLFISLFTVLAISSIFLSTTRSVSAATPIVRPVIRAIIQREFRPVCGLLIKGMARCHAHVVTNNAGTPLDSSQPPSSSYGPAQFHTAYNLPCTPGGAVQSNCATPSSFGGQTIAIVDAYKAPNIESDLNTYSNYYGLPSCTRANGCLSIVNENGGTTLPATTDSGWAFETSLDVEVAHMVCQTCKILLVETNASFVLDLGTGVATAARLGATEISNSYGSSEWSGETSYDTNYYKHPGIAITASSGDNGYGAEFPAASPNVIATGGTTLQLTTTNSYVGENVWTGTGSGCSKYESANTWQTILPNWTQTNCGTHRAISDIAADADPNTGAAVYDSTPYGGTVGWYQVGGTSLAAPLVAGMYALANGVPVNTNASSLPYLYFSSSNAHDITVGSNGACTTLMCKAALGYDGPSGLGSPNGITGLQQTTLTPVPTATPTPTQSVPTSTPTPLPTITNAPLTPTPTIGQPLTFGYTTVGNLTDVFDQNYIDGSKFKMGSTNGTLQKISVYVASVATSPRNQYQLAIYTDNNGKPGTLLAKSLSGTLTANSWNSIAVSAPLQANTNYWLMYNTNSSSSSLNDVKFINSGILMGAYSASSVAFGTWPQTFTSALDGYEYSLYATYTSQ